MTLMLVGALACVLVLCLTVFCVGDAYLRGAIAYPTTVLGVALLSGAILGAVQSTARGQS